MATRLESTPPLRLRTSRSKPTLRTSLRMKPTRIRLTSEALIASGGKTGSERLARALMPDPAQLVDRQLEFLIPEQRIGQPLTPDVAEIEAGKHQRLVRILFLGDDVAIRADRHRSAPKVCAVLVADPVAVQKKGRQELGVRSADQAIRLRRAQPLIGGDAASGAGRRTDDHIRAFEAEDVGAREVPDVLTNEDTRASKVGLESAEAIAGGEITLLVEHPVGG